MNWEAYTAIGTMISTGAFVAGAVFVLMELRQASKERLFSISSHLYEIWQSPDFQDDQLYLLHKLTATSWDEFVMQARGERAERAFHRVGSFYDHVGSLIGSKLIDERRILPTIAGSAIAVWSKIEPLVQEARRRENAFLFDHFERMLPECRECYVNISAGGPSPAAEAPEIETVDVAELGQLLEGNQVVALDVREQTDGRKIKGAVRATPNDLAGWIAAIEPGRAVVAYDGSADGAGAARAARMLLAAGFREARALKGGYDAWSAAGFPREPL